MLGFIIRYCDTGQIEMADSNKTGSQMVYE